MDKKILNEIDRIKEVMFNNIITEASIVPTDFAVAFLKKLVTNFSGNQTVRNLLDSNFTPQGAGIGRIRTVDELMNKINNAQDFAEVRRILGDVQLDLDSFVKNALKSDPDFRLEMVNILNDNNFGDLADDLAEFQRNKIDLPNYIDDVDIYNDMVDLMENLKTKIESIQGLDPKLKQNLLDSFGFNDMPKRIDPNSVDNLDVEETIETVMAKKWDDVPYLTEKEIQKLINSRQDMAEKLTGIRSTLSELLKSQKDALLEIQSILKTMSNLDVNPEQRRLLNKTLFTKLEEMTKQKKEGFERVNQWVDEIIPNSLKLGESTTRFKSEIRSSPEWLKSKKLYDGDSAKNFEKEYKTFDELQSIIKKELDDVFYPSRWITSKGLGDFLTKGQGWLKFPWQSAWMKKYWSMFFDLSDPKYSNFRQWFWTGQNLSLKGWRNMAKQLGLKKMGSTALKFYLKSLKSQAIIHFWWNIIFVLLERLRTVMFYDINSPEYIEAKKNFNNYFGEVDSEEKSEEETATWSLIKKIAQAVTSSGMDLMSDGLNLAIPGFWDEFAVGLNAATNFVSMDAFKIWYDKWFGRAQQGLEESQRALEQTTERIGGDLQEVPDALPPTITQSGTTTPPDTETPDTETPEGEQSMEQIVSEIKVQKGLRKIDGQDVDWLDYYVSEVKELGGGQYQIVYKDEQYLPNTIKKVDGVWQYSTGPLDGKKF
jgi:hypothetical protein